MVSTVSSFGGRNADIPQTATREVESTIRVADGETIAIGGLLRDQETRTISRIPILSRLPVLGELFKRRNTNRRKSEVTIFLTVRVLTDETGAEEEGGQGLAPVVRPRSGSEAPQSDRKEGREKGAKESARTSSRKG